MLPPIQLQLRMSLENNYNDDNNMLHINIDEQTHLNLQLDPLEPNETHNIPLKKNPRLNDGRPKDIFIWKYFDKDEYGKYRVCQVKVPVSTNHPDGKCNKKYQQLPIQLINMVERKSKKGSYIV